jgi:hypothetical protein
MDVKGTTARQAVEWLVSIWTSAGQVEQRYEVREGLKWRFQGAHRVDDSAEPMKTRKIGHDWSKLKPKELKKREKGHVEQLVGSRLWRSLKPPVVKVLLTLLTDTDPKTLTVTISTRDLATQLGIRRSTVIRATRTMEQLGMYVSETTYDKVNKKNKTKTYRLTWYSLAWQAWLKGRTIPTTTTKATYITVSETDHQISLDGTGQNPPVCNAAASLVSECTPASVSL